ncbi:MAG: hypothetical protein RBT11_09425 [Desulfobacterales bacterium]|nr:hypothetical protein [Desulfobacterales bacterium]
MRKITWMIGIMLFCVAVAFTAAGRENEPPAPIAVFPEKTFQFETILEGVEVKHDFIVQNKGTAELLIQHVKPG